MELRLPLQLNKTNKKTERGYLYNERVIVHCLKMAQKQRLVNMYSNQQRNGRAKGSKKKRTCRRAEGERRKKMNI